MLVCPGDHYSLSELPQAQVTGGILATALVFRYRMLFPELPKPTRTFCQRRAVERLCNGVNVFLHSKRGNSHLVKCQCQCTFRFISFAPILSRLGNVHIDKENCQINLSAVDDHW